MYSRIFQVFVLWRNPNMILVTINRIIQIIIIKIKEWNTLCYSRTS